MSRPHSLARRWGSGGAHAVMGDNPDQKGTGWATGGGLHDHGVGKCPVHGTAPRNGERGPGQNLARFLSHPPS